MIDEYHDLGVLNFEMEAGTLFKMGLVYRFAAACVVGIVAQRNDSEQPDLSAKDAAVDSAIQVADRHGRPLEPAAGPADACPRSAPADGQAARRSEACSPRVSSRVARSCVSQPKGARQARWCRR